MIVCMGVHVLDVLVRPVEQIPDGQGGQLVEQIRMTAAGSAGGTALVLGSPELLAVRAELAQRWAGWLTRQDAQRYSPHVTVQNKVEPAHARALVAQLQAGFALWSMTGTGLQVWSYLGGPWEPVETVPFSR